MELFGNRCVLPLHAHSPSTDLDRFDFFDASRTIRSGLHGPTLTNPLAQAYKRPVFVFPPCNIHGYLGGVIDRSHMNILFFQVTAIDGAIYATDETHTVLLRHPALEQIQKGNATGVV